MEKMEFAVVVLLLLTCFVIFCYPWLWYVLYFLLVCLWFFQYVL